MERSEKLIVLQKRFESLGGCELFFRNLQLVPGLQREFGFNGTVTSTELMIKERIGQPGDAHLARLSPINAVRNIHIPVLLIYGTGDSEELKHKCQHMAEVMRQAGKQVTLDDFRTHMRMLREIEEFLEANL